MNLRFKLLDRDSIATVIEEPQGWDGMQIELNRDLETHGMMFDYGVNELIFYKLANKIIRREYKDYGIKGDLTLVIEIRCGDFFSWITGNVTYDELYRGKLLFTKFDAEDGENVYSKIPVETTGDVIDFKNAFNQKVDLQSLIAFDKTTALTPYAGLGFDLELPSKGILMQNRADTTEDLSFDIIGDDDCGEPGSTSNIKAQIEFPMNVVGISEIGGFYFGNEPTTTQIENGCEPPPFPEGEMEGEGSPPIPWFPFAMSPVENYADGLPNFGQVTGPVDISFKMKGSINLVNCTMRTVRILLMRFINGGDPDVTTDGAHETLFESQIQNSPAETSSPHTFNFDESYTDTIALNPDDQFYFFLYVSYSKTSGQYGQVAFNLSFESGNFFYMKTLSKLPETDSKVFLINEAISRVSEAITNDRIRFYSEYFGRTDSQPYAVDADGCGSLEAITKGLFIRRQENRIPGKPFAMAISMEDIWKGIEPIHHIGMSIEPDVNRAGFNRLRMEHWKYFYSDDIIMTCANVSKVRTKVIEREHYSIFKCGYDKWEAEEYNGIDECLTKREYRTTFTQLTNELIKISTFISSPYTWEVTRRKNSDSKDFRYDNNDFIVCVKRDEDGNFVVEIPNITLPENIIDPDTFYNWRIRPVYNAMRWIDKLHSGYRPASVPNKLYFTDGDGNYHAKGEMTSTDCKLENAPLAENADIDETLFEDPLACLPLLLPERVEFDFPMSYKDFKALKTWPYGKIIYTGCKSGEGWIDTVNWKPEEGTATFTLIPKY